MQLPNDFASLNATMAKLPHSKMAKVVSAVALIYIAYLCAQITWQLIADTSPVNMGRADNTAQHQSSSKRNVNVNRLVSLNLFGTLEKVDAVEQAPIVDVPETKLKLTLSGVVASSNPEAAAAIIENNGSQETYGIGDQITNTRASLEQVHADRVIIKQSGRMETLMLDGFNYSKAQPAKAPKRDTSKKLVPGKTSGLNVIDHRKNKPFLNQARQFKQDVVNNPTSIAAYLRISPARVNNKIIGYRLSPGKQSEFFKASGLKSGDIAIQMNGLDLTEGSQAQQALQLLKSEQEISLLLDRNGELTEILFSIEN